jgi:transcriptional regulator with XRE-family HTH domain
MVQNHLSVNEVLARLRQTADNERVNRGTLSGVINNSYRAKPSAHLVLGLARVLNTTSDYLLGLSSDSDARALARRYALANEDQLLSWLAETSPELAEIMRAIREIPDEEQQYILEVLARDIAAFQSEQGLSEKGDADA